MQIHVNREGQTMGSYSLEEVKAKIADNSLLHSDLGWHEGLENWVTLGDLLFFDSIRGATRPQPPDESRERQLQQSASTGTGGGKVEAKKYLTFAVGISLCVLAIAVYIIILVFFFDRRVPPGPRILDFSLLVVVITGIWNYFHLATPGTSKRRVAGLKQALLIMIIAVVAVAALGISVFYLNNVSKVEEAIRLAIEKPRGELTERDLEQVYTLHLNGNQLTSVKELEKLTQLTSLYLDGNKLTDVKGLEKLTQLEVLSLDNNPALTKAQIAELQKALPNCTIYSNPTK